MRWLPVSVLPGLLSGLLLRADGLRGAEQACILTSMVRPELEIRLERPRSAAGQWEGTLNQRGRPLLPFRLSMAQGYGSRFWGTLGDENGWGNPAIPFAGGQPYGALERRARVDAFLFAGLGSELYYGTWDGRSSGLFRAGEGFWRVGAGCRHRFLFGAQEP